MSLTQPSNEPQSAFSSLSSTFSIVHMLAAAVSAIRTTILYQFHFSKNLALYRFVKITEMLKSRFKGIIARSIMGGIP